MIGAAFYLMERVDGFNATLGLPEPHARTPRSSTRWAWRWPTRSARWPGSIRASAACGTSASAERWGERQVPRWRKQLDGYAELPGYPGPSIPRLDDVARWLDEHRPTDIRPGLIHGDFHFANVLIDRATPRVAAIVDWELTTIGEPLLDLGHLLASWPRPGREAITPVGDGSGLPTADEVIGRYDGQVDRDLSDLRWFRVLACYRLGIILEGSHARAFSGLTPVEIGDRLHASTLDLFAQAAELIDDPT